MLLKALLMVLSQQAGHVQERPMLAPQAMCEEASRGGTRHWTASVYSKPVSLTL